MQKRTKNLLTLFFSMMKIGLFTFGGGYAMIALLQREFIEKKKWIGEDEFSDLVAIAESTPGPMAINCATYLGYKAGGVLGALLATVAVCIPSFVIIYVISLVFDAFLALRWVEYAFRGIQVCVTYLILSAGIKMFRGMKKDAFHLVLFCAVFGCIVTFSLCAVSFSSIFYILICGVLGLCAYFLGVIRKGAGK